VPVPASYRIRSAAPKEGNDVYTSPTQLRTGTQPGHVSAEPPASPGPALLNILVIPLGIAGLGGVWQALRMTVAAPAWPAEVLFGLSTVIWISLSAAYIVM
jgi:hypothetical protein